MAQRDNIRKKQNGNGGITSSLADINGKNA